LGKFRATEPRARCAVRSPHMMEGYIAMGLLNRDGLTDKKIGAVVRMRRVKLGMSQASLAGPSG